MCRKPNVKRWPRLTLIVVWAAVMQGCAGKTDPQITCTFNDSAASSTIVEYLLYLPPEYGDESRLWPLVLFLHGAGQIGTQLDIVREEGLPRRVAEGWRPPFVLVSPQTRSHTWDNERLIALLDHLQESLDIDPDRTYVTGLSFGGAGTWELAATYRDRFAAAVPICGYGDPETAQRLQSLPIWVFHGAKDDTIPLACSEKMVNALHAVGGDVRFTVYPEATHDSWTKAYAAPELYDWLLSQKNSK